MAILILFAASLAVGFLFPCVLPALVCSSRGSTGGPPAGRSARAGRPRARPPPALTPPGLFAPPPFKAPPPPPPHPRHLHDPGVFAEQVTGQNHGRDGPDAAPHRRLARPD